MSGSPNTKTDPEFTIVIDPDWGCQNANAATPPDERRTTERHHCSEIRLVRLLERPSFQCYPAFIRDFSRRGIGLLFTQSLKVGTRLAVGLSGILTATVCHASPLPHNYWHLGCSLSRNLSDEEMDALLTAESVSDPIVHDIS